jgi:hypothetical protein
MGNHQKLSAENLLDFRNRFIRTITFIYDNVGVNSFNNLSSTIEGRFSPNFSSTIFDSLTIATDQLLELGFNFQLDRVQQNRITLLQDEDYKFALTKETMRKAAIQNRIQKVKDILYQA